MFFCKRIDAIIDNTSKGDKQLIDKLIGEKVQLFDEFQPVNPNTFIDTKARGYRAA